MTISGLKYCIPAALAFVAAIPANALTGGASSGPLTDVNAPDSAKLCASEAARAKLVKDSKVIFINGGKEVCVDRDSVESLLARFYVDQLRNSQDPEAPYFTFMSKDANLAMGVGGVIKMRGWFDWNGMIDGASFNPYLITMPKTPETMKSLGASVAGTTIFFNIMGRHTPLGDYRAYIEGGFNGYANSGFKLKKAWFQIGDFTAGLATTTFSDPAAQPEVLDGAGASGKLDKSNVLVRYLHTWRDRWTVAGSVEFPSSQIADNDPYTSDVRDYVPDFALLGQYQWNRGMSHVRLAGLLRTIPYRDLEKNTNHNVIGWGAQLSSVVRAGRIVTLYAVAGYGHGISSYTCDLSIGKYDLLADPSLRGRMYAPATLSLTAGAKVQILPGLSSTLCLATLRHLPKDTPASDTYKYGQYLAINAVYDFSPRLQLGVEYLAGKRKNCGGAEANVNRAEAVMTFSF